MAGRPGRADPAESEETIMADEHGNLTSREWALSGRRGDRREVALEQATGVDFSAAGEIAEAINDLAGRATAPRLGAPERLSMAGAASDAAADVQRLADLLDPYRRGSGRGRIPDLLIA